ncbi:hypothetical protein [Gymnodinialimonas ceratoperidinii]|uniref:Uncharacterized protein n=1 Tax=Gymnodinialimonas ceratoperidinii TaxID=2856823 RepID=A0A8F6TT18_9RHOB|nr:hypothetical protein [Gymnodinialimonas ceratoperidinii]QXT38426.1 hypothetical protein KYE46_10745 [Gymnodinialimonas ceratoperidinii]
MNKVFLTAVAVLAATTAGHAQTIGPERVAAAILTGFQFQDVDMIAPFANETNAAFFHGLQSGTEDPAELFDGDRGAAGIAWDGMILPVRYNDRAQAVVPFAIEGEATAMPLGSGVEGRYISVVLSLDSPEDTSWGLVDFNYIDRAEYAAMAETR